MAALIAVAGIYARADQPMADVVARAQGGFHIRAIGGIHVYRVVRALTLGRIDQLAFKHREVIGVLCLQLVDGGQN